ncbi:MAG TPA: thrombospondin type 3 repeat-containing protein, partial [Planctomycetota bacterium]|nr:thrombospondin type 3 repeat-containing protein [Planctomycetota bacterium]
VLNNRSILDWWTADGNHTTENRIVMYSDLTGVTASPELRSTFGVLFGWPSDLIWIGNQLYGIESFQRYLYTVVPETGVCTAIGPQNTYEDVYSLAYDVTGDRLFGVDLKKKKLLRFNRTTGLITNIGGSSLVGYPLIRSLAYSDAEQMLYANDQQSDKLIRINPDTGLVTYVSTMPAEQFGRIEELSFFHGELYASDGLLNAVGDLAGAQLQHVDIATGATFNIGPIIDDVSPHSLIINSLPEDFLWTQVSGPGTASFSDPKALAPTVTFSAPGIYELALTAFAWPTPVVDSMFVNASVAVDTDGDGVPDELDNCPTLANPGQEDCDGNGAGDLCEIAEGLQQDCNSNGIPDNCDILTGVAQDCDGSGVPDSCEIASGISQDCDGNSIPDACDIASGASLDCNTNAIPDSCDLAAGTSLDSNANAIPDECEPNNGFVYCAGDGSATPCPCGNVGGAFAGCANSTGFGARIYNAGGVSCSADDAALVGIHLPAGKLALFITGDQQLNGGNGVAFFDGLLCLTVRRRYTPGLSSPTGVVSLSSPVTGSLGLIQPGQTWYFQSWYRSGIVGAPCGTAANTSNGLGIVFGP